MQRMTRQRRIILETLQGLKTHPTADEVYALVRQKLPHVSLGTVYRNLDLLHRNGLALRLNHSGAQTRFDGDTSQHCHIRCVECGCIGDVFRDVTIVKMHHVSSETGYQVTGYTLEYEGICPACQQNATGGTESTANRQFLQDN
ncbi:MAG TPA: transcriptional repressor [Candidatus Hydrogenedentes bacterium]|nr:transcriptional repressor [Candidatus Hydrogenedentota bacterium]